MLVMGALDAGELEQALSRGADVVVWREDQVRAVSAAGGGRVHVKLDTGMGRLGTREADQALERSWRRPARHRGSCWRA